jgi:hypothetical protein
MPKQYPSLRVHIWGGLGSQLFAMALAFELQRKFPKRQLLLVLHSSGVTKRAPEICGLFPEFNYLEVDDFSSRHSHDSRTSKNSLKSIFIRFARKWSICIGVLAEENDGRTRKVRKWTFSVRGHYFHRQIDQEFLVLLGSRLEDYLKVDTDKYLGDTILHYRLGDLLELSNKTYIDPKRIAKVLSRESEEAQVRIFSDSPEKAISLLRDFSPDLNLESEDLKTPSAIWAAAHSETFVGTSSKISYWVLLLRFLYKPQAKNFMPNEDKRIIDTIASEVKNVQFF